MQSRAISLSFVVIAALGLLTGCPIEDKSMGSETDPATGTTVEVDTLEGPTTGSGVAADTTADSGTLDPTTGEPDPLCACIGPAEEHAFTCGSGACGELIPVCVGGPFEPGDPEDPNCELELDEAVLTCALDLLIAGEDGVVEWSFTPDGSYSEDGGFIQMFPGRQGLTRSYSRDDSWTMVTPAGVVPLKAAEYFQGCKDEVTTKAKFDCLIAWSDVSPTAQCHGAFDL